MLLRLSQHLQRHLQQLLLRHLTGYRATVQHYVELLPATVRPGLGLLQRSLHFACRQFDVKRLLLETRADGAVICKLLVKLGIPGVSTTTPTSAMMTLKDPRVGETAAAPTYPVPAANASLAANSAMHSGAAQKQLSATDLIIGCEALFECIEKFMLSVSQSPDADCSAGVSEQASQTDLHSDNNLLLADLSMFGKFCHLVEAAASTMLGEMNAASTMLGEVKELQWYPLDEPDSSAAYIERHVQMI